MRLGHLGRTLAVLALAGGCASRPDAEADAVVARYRRAVERDDPSAAYALLSDDVRRRVTREEFAARWKETRSERAGQARALAAAPAREDEASAAAGGRTVALRRVEGGWRVEEAPLPGESADTPEAAVRALVRALERRDYRAFTRLLTAAQRERLEKAIAARLDRLRAAAGRPIETEGDRAVLQYDPGLRLWLQREGGQWRVDDFE